MTWVKAVVFAGYSGFLHYLQMASLELATICINVTKNYKNPKVVVVVEVSSSLVMISCHTDNCFVDVIKIAINQFVSQCFNEQIFRNNN